MVSSANQYEMDGTFSPAAKRIKHDVLHEQQVAWKYCQRLLHYVLADDDGRKNRHQLPTSLSKKKTGNSLEHLRDFFVDHGFRTSIILSPRTALSVYKDSCTLSKDMECNSGVEGKEWLIIMFAMHPQQDAIERLYSSTIKDLYCLFIFSSRIQEACPQSVKNNEELAELLAEVQKACHTLATSPKPSDEAQHLLASFTECTSRMMQLAVEADPRIRIEQLQHELQRIKTRNTTLANAHAQLLMDFHGLVIKDMYFKSSSHKQFERITIYLYDPEIDLCVPPRFTFLPSLQTVLENGAQTVAENMVLSLWNNLLRQGYFLTEEIKGEMTPNLEKYFLSGLSNDTSLPLLLNAHFTPCFPLSFYFNGEAGTGKSSLVRNFSPSLNDVVGEHADPEVLVRFVKQNLNKPYDVLKLELELRPNNNDLSVMSIIQGRRMTMSQTKPGLVVVGMEEMPSNRSDTDPNQLESSRLISQRFSGRNGEYREGQRHPRNISKGGITGDATIIAIFTSNYTLEIPCQEALKNLEMFQNLKCIHVNAVSGDNRVNFAKAYVYQCVKDRFVDLDPTIDLELDIPMGDGDTRPLVRHLRMLAFYVCAQVVDRLEMGGSIKAKIEQHGSRCKISCLDSNEAIQLRVGSLDNLFPCTPKSYDSRTQQAMRALAGTLQTNVNHFELSVIIDFWLARALAPAVILSTDRDAIGKVVEAIGALRHINLISNIDASEYKMMKSLYDEHDTPNLRDDILRFGRGASVAVELFCETVDSQLCIREIIEDTPSMTAFSSANSALYKSGLLFAIYVKGEITPEVRSRASFIM